MAESSDATPQAAPQDPAPLRVIVTGATGFVGRYIVRELVARGHHPVCLVRDRSRLSIEHVARDRIDVVQCDLYDTEPLAAVMQDADAVIHLVGIIFEHPLRGQTFERVHVETTRHVIEAAKPAGVKRIVHMSALGARPHAVSRYHQTKWEAEGLVRASALGWTIFRPSVIHGADGEFMRMMRTMVCDWFVPAFGFVPMPFPVIPYFGKGTPRLQPVSVKDVAACFVTALNNPEHIGQAYELGGPEAMSWKEFYRVCRELIQSGRCRKPIVGLPIILAKLLAETIMRLPILPEMLRFNIGQVQMSLEDLVCDHTRIEKAFGIRLRDFRHELADYAALID
ncbi:MAG TPA: complex I NDUFA9 subunit family protein [Phycisphaerae bacterium]|nr:complex I NDUFA9 subunit family protein [Phycisphaerae bacterium]